MTDIVERLRLRIELDCEEPAQGLLAEAIDEIERLQELALPEWYVPKQEVDALKAEIERLQGELDKACRLLSQCIGWQRDAEIAKAKQAAEIERLRAERQDWKLLAEDLGKARDLDKAEIERLQGIIQFLDAAKAQSMIP